jgi:hypothetical protein
MTRRGSPGASNLVRSALLSAAATLVGCTSADTKPAPAPAKPTYAGRWTRGDGKVFQVQDDGTKVHGALASAPTDYTFDLARTGAGLEGTAKIKDGSQTVETKWRLHADGDLKLAGDKEYVDLDPSTGKVLARGTEPQEFSIERAPAAAPADDKAALRASADAVTSDEDARAQEMARLQKAADDEASSSQGEDAQKEALRAAAEKAAAEADQEDAERQKLRASADAGAH